MLVYVKFSFYTALSRLEKLIRSPIAFVFFSQFLLGIIQVKAFFSYSGEDYLDFSFSYLIGSVGAIILSLNTENEILAGVWNSALKKYFTILVSGGVLISMYAMSVGQIVPHFLAFTFLQVSIRIFVAWANSAKPFPIALAIGGVAVMVTAVFLSLNSLIIVIFGALAIAKKSGAGVPASRIEQEGRFLFKSFQAFLAYIPHTLSGIVIGNIDRFLALNYVNGNVAETYLRTLQMLSWSTFVMFPIVFAMRRRIIEIGQIAKYREAVSVFSIIIILLSFNFFSIYFLINLYNFDIQIHNESILLLLVAISFSQSYQVLSIILFIGKEYSKINKITVLSSIFGAIVSIGLVWAYESALALAIGLLVGWGMQFGLTVRELMRYQLRSGS
jgi:hypothetical protein